MTMFTRRNWVLRCSIIINLAVLVYIGTNIMVKSGPGDFGFETAGGGGRSLASDSMSAALDAQPTSTGRGEKQPSVRTPAADASSSRSDEMRTFVLEKTKDVYQVSKDKNYSDDTVKVSSTDDSKVMTSQMGVVSEKGDSGVVSPNSSFNNTSFGGDVSFVTEPDLIGPTEAKMPADETVLDTATLERLRDLMKCHDKAYEPLTRQRGEFWVLFNYVRADHGAIACHESITYTTHGDFTFMDNLVPLLERWNNPVSVAIHAPGTDLVPTANTIRYLRDCSGSELVKKWTTFHVFFSTKHIPKQIPNMKKLLNEPYNCSLSAPYASVNISSLYKTQKKLLYPVNVGRNVARDAALTHYILASDIELYPSPGLVARFLNLVARDQRPLHAKTRRVFPLSIFEVASDQMVPFNKTQLVSMLQKGSAIPFHKKVCSGCHNVPKSKEWIQENETSSLEVFHIGKRTGAFIHWEPIFIGTHDDPLYDERLSWEGKSDKMTQGYVLCVLDYEFMILNNAFLVHRPGIKTLKRDDKRAQLAGKTNMLIRKFIFPELKVLYGTRKGCAV